MFGQIIDLLSKKESDRQKIFFITLKIVFSATLSTKIYIDFFGTYTIIPITDFQGITNFFLSGNVIICFALFYFVWALSYGLTSFLLSIIAIWLNSKLYFLITQLFKITPEEFKNEIDKSWFFKAYVKFIASILNSTDIIEYENNTIKPGTHYYKFYDYLLKVENGKKAVESYQFSTTIALLIQFLVFYNCFGLTFLSNSKWFFAISVILIILLFIFSFCGYAIATFVEIKHSRILDYMERLTPEYKNKKTGAKQSKNEHMEDLLLYIQEADKALNIINANLENKLTDLEFQIALAKKLGYSDRESTAIAKHRLTSDQMINLLEPKDLEKPTELAIVTLDHSILPQDVPSRIDEKQIKVSGEIWRIHKFDADPCPSNPHGHNVETGYKLHLGDGQLYTSKCKPLGKKIDKKDLMEIRKQLKGIALPTLTV